MATSFALHELKSNLQHFGFALIDFNHLVKEIKTHISPRVNIQKIRNKFSEINDGSFITFAEASKIVKLCAKAHNYELLGSPLEHFLTYQVPPVSPQPIKNSQPQTSDRLLPVELPEEEECIHDQIELENYNWIEAYQKFLWHKYSSEQLEQILSNWTTHPIHLMAAALNWVEICPSENCFQAAARLANNNTLSSLDEFFYPALRNSKEEFAAVVIAIVHYDFLKDLPPQKFIPRIEIVFGEDGQVYRSVAQPASKHSVTPMLSKSIKVEVEKTWLEKLAENEITLEYCEIFEKLAFSVCNPNIYLQKVRMGNFGGSIRVNLSEELARKLASLFFNVLKKYCITACACVRPRKTGFTIYIECGDRR